MKNRHFFLLFLITFAGPTFAANPETSASSGDANLSAIIEVVGAIVKAAEKLDDIFLFLVLICTLSIVAVITHMLHRKVVITLSAFVLASVSVGIGAFYTFSTRVNLDGPTTGVTRLFLPLKGTMELGPFIISLENIDTLKTGIEKDEENPWIWNRNTFGNQALLEFLEIGRNRLQTEFISDPNLACWPTYDKLVAIREADDEEKWIKFIKSLEPKVKNIKTKKSTKIKTAFSKWPLVKLKICDQKNGSTIVERFYPDRSTLNLTDSSGTRYKLVIDTIFNGDRDIGESEACVLKFSTVNDGAV